MKRSMNLLVIIFLTLLSCTKQGPTIIDPVDPVDENSKLKVTWELSIPNLSEVSHCNPIMYNDLVLIIGYSEGNLNDCITAINKSSGMIEWTWNSTGAIKRHPINAKLSGDILVMNTKDGIYALDLTTREIIWEDVFEEDVVWQTPFEIIDSEIYMHNNITSNGSGHPYSDSSRLISYNINTGNQTYITGYKREETEYRTAFYHPPVGHLYNGEKSIVFETAYLSPKHGDNFFLPDITSYNLEEKKVNWTTGSFCPISGGHNSPPLLYNNNIITVCGYTIHSIDASTGSINWVYEVEEAEKKRGFAFTDIKIYNNNVYGIMTAGIVFAINANTGIEEFLINGVLGFDGPAPISQNDILIEDDIIYANSYSRSALILIDAIDGSIIEEFKNEDYSGRNILYDEDSDTFFITADEKVIAFKVDL